MGEFKVDLERAIFGLFLAINTCTATAHDFLHFLE